MARDAAELAVKVKATGSAEFREEMRSLGDDGVAAFERVQRASQTQSSEMGGFFDKAGNAAAGIGGIVEGALGRVFGFVQDVSGAVGTVIEKVVEIGGTFGAAAGIAGAGVGGLVYAARSYTQSVAEGMSATGGLAAELGTTTEALSRMQVAFRLNGADGDKLGTALTTMKGKVVSLAEGTQSTIDSFQSLGLTMADFRKQDGSLKGTREQLDLILDRIAKVKNPTLTAKAAMDVFGSSAKDLGTLLEAGSAGLAKAEKEADAYGTVIKDGAVGALDEALNAQSRLMESLRGLGMGLTRVFFPFFVQSSDGISKWLNDNRSRIEGWLTSLKGVAERIKADVIGLFGVTASVGAGAIGAATGGLIQKASLGSTPSSGGDDDEEEEDDEESPAAAGGLTEAGVQRQVLLNGKLIDLDEQRARQRELAASRTAIVDGKVVSLRGALADKAQESGRRLAEVDGVEVDLDAKRQKREEEGLRRYAEVNGKRIELTYASLKSQAGAATPAFNFPVFGYIASAFRGVAGFVSNVVSALQGKLVTGIVGTVQALGNAASQAGSAFAALGSYIYTGLTGAVPKLGSFTDIVRSVGSVFGDLRRGLARGFETQWARDLKGIADNVIATIGALEPLVRAGFSAMGGAVTSFAAPIRAATGALAEFVVGLTSSAGAFVQGPLVRGLMGARDAVGETVTGIVSSLAEIVTAGDVAWGDVVAPIAGMIGLLAAASGPMGMAFAAILATVAGFGVLWASQWNTGFDKAEATVAQTGKRLPMVFKTSLQSQVGSSSLAPEARGMVQQASLPLLGLGRLPALVSAVFARNWNLIKFQFAQAWASIKSFGNQVVEGMSLIGSWIGLTPVGGPAKLNAVTVAGVAAIGQYTGAFDILKSVLVVTTLATAVFTYATLISTVALKFFMETVLFSGRLVLGLAVVMSAAWRVGAVVAIASFTRIRAVMVAFWAFAMLGPTAFAARMTAVWVALTVRATAFYAAMTLGNVLWFGGIFLLIALLVAGFIYLIGGIDGLKGAWDLAVQAFGLGFDVLRATVAGFTDLFTDPLRFFGTLWDALWLKVVNGAIWAWNQIKSTFGLAETAYRDPGQEGVDAILGGQKGDAVNPRMREIYEANKRVRDEQAKVKRKDTEFVDPFPGSKDDDVVDGPNGLAPKREVNAALRAELKRRDDERYVAEVTEARQRALDANKRKEDARAAANSAAKGDAPASKPAAPGAPAAPDAGISAKLWEGLKGAGGMFGFGGGSPAGEPGKSGTGMLDMLFGMGGGEADLLKRFGLGGADGKAPAVGTDALIEEMRRLGDQSEKAKEGVVDPNTGVVTPDTRRASLGLGDLLASLTGGPNLRTPYASGPQQVKEEVEEALTPGERGLAREREREKEIAARNQERDDARDGRTRKIVAATVEIADGDKRLYGNPEAFEGLTKLLSEFGLRAVVDQPRTV